MVVNCASFWADSCLFCDIGRKFRGIGRGEGGWFLSAGFINFVEESAIGGLWHRPKCYYDSRRTLAYQMAGGHRLPGDQSSQTVQVCAGGAQYAVLVEAQQEVDECRRPEAGASGLVLLEVGGWEENAEFIGHIFGLAYLNPARLRLGFFVR